VSTENILWWDPCAIDLISFLPMGTMCEELRLGTFGLGQLGFGLGHQWGGELLRLLMMTSLRSLIFNRSWQPDCISAPLSRYLPVGIKLSVRKCLPRFSFLLSQNFDLKTPLFGHQAEVLHL